jgi:ABC-type Mn2+/Zn2+ transport system ATPase subunit
MKMILDSSQQSFLIKTLVFHLQMFIDEVMDLVELLPLKDALVGLPSVSGLSTEQRKRLTIAVELVANPSIIFMDEPTSGLDARAAAIVMRAVRNTVDTGRTVVCTIHQPSIDIFESFDEVNRTILTIVLLSRIMTDKHIGGLNISKHLCTFAALPNETWRGRDLCRSIRTTLM